MGKDWFEKTSSILLLGGQEQQRAKAKARGMAPKHGTAARQVRTDWRDWARDRPKSPEGPPPSNVKPPEKASALPPAPKAAATTEQPAAAEDEAEAEAPAAANAEATPVPAASKAPALQAAATSAKAGATSQPTGNRQSSSGECVWIGW